MLLAFATGCGSYGELSPTAYEFAKALYSVSNRQAEDKLEATAQQIQQAQSNGDISPEEADWLQEIIQQSRAGHWKEANQAARQMMEDQIR